jgi:enoyl-CoA hydratase/carnithine racemase
MPEQVTRAAVPTSSSALSLTCDGPVAVIAFDAPELFNGIDESNLDRFPRMIGDAAASGAQYLVLRGGARQFCSGASSALLRTLAESAPAARVAIIRRAQRWVKALLESPMLTVAAVDGLVAGAGFDLALAFDARLFGSATRMNLWYAKLGVIPDLGGIDLLSDRIGHQRALEFYARSATLSRDDAVALGWGEAMDSWPESAAAWRKDLTRRFPVEASSFAAAKAFALAPLLERLGPRQEAAALLQANLFSTEHFRETAGRIALLKKALSRA